MEAITIKRITEAELAKELREQYIKNPPEGMTSDEVRDMSADDLLDMDYFLHELMIWMMTISAKKVFISSKLKPSVFHARLCAGYFHFRVRQKSNFPNKARKAGNLKKISCFQFLILRILTGYKHTL